jgi:ferredoxin
MGADGVSEVITQDVDEALRPRIDEVVRSCPVEAISVR